MKFVKVNKNALLVSDYRYINCFVPLQVLHLLQPHLLEFLSAIFLDNLLNPQQNITQRIDS